METIYWITRLDAICDTLAAIIAISVVVSIIAGCIMLVNSNCNWEHEIKGFARAKKILKYGILTFAIAIIANIFTPSTKQALMIYGLGGTIDYIKQNDTAKQLPDKVVNALDKWVDSLNEKEESK